MNKTIAVYAGKALLSGFFTLALNTQAHDMKIPLAPQVYATECASCHTAYPPGLLVSADWKKTLDNLSRHFGTDASVTAEELQGISAYLLAHAATDASRYTAQSDPVRLTRTAWFERKHLRKLPASVWADPLVKSASNCQACHTRVDKGSFSENEVAVPGFPGKHW